MKLAFLSRSSRPFDGATIGQEALGGTQSALVYMSRELVKQGHEVFIFCQCPAPGDYDGVHYRPVNELIRVSKQQPLDFFIPVADESALKLGIQSRFTLWWSHNDYSFLWDEMPDLRADMAAQLACHADKLFTVSQWHTHRLAEVFALPEKHFFTTRNGVEWPYFAQDRPRVKGRLFYTSVPDRGLDVLLQLFPRIRAQVPAAELHVYSSFTVWGKSAQWDQQMAGDVYARARATEGVMLHSPLPHAPLAQELLQGELWLYPNHGAVETGFWAETSCIAALEAQAAGLPVISSQRGALPETIRDGQTGILIAGDPYSQAYQDTFINQTVALLRDDARRQQMSQAARQHIQSRHTWAQIATEWSQYLNTLVSTRQNTPPLKSPFPTPQISVMIPTYNRADNLKNALQSLTQQTYPAFEVIVCDDGSDDNTHAVALAFKEQLNLRYRYQENAGFRAATARNMGLKIARGKLLLFLDSDVVVPPGFLQAHWQAHQQHPQVLVNSYVYRMLEACPTDLGAPPDDYIPKHLDILKGDSRDRYQLFERESPVEETYFLDSNALSVMRTDIDHMGGFDDEFVGWGHEDTELGYRAAKIGLKLLLIKEACTAYHQYHDVSPAKEEERALNWEILARKHGLEKWYHPLWELPVEAQVWLDLQGEPPTDWRLLPVWSGHFMLKTGQHSPLHNNYHTIRVRNGVVTAIE